MIYVPKFKTSKICTNLNFKENSFICLFFICLFRQISPEMEHFRVPRNQRFSLPPTMVVSGIRQFRPLHPWTWSLPYAIQIQILYTPLKVWNNGIRRKLLKYLNMWWSYFGNIPVNISQTSLRKMFAKIGRWPTTTIF